MASSLKSPGTLADDSAVGTVAWSNPSNATSDNGVYATASSDGATVSHYLKATNFGFTIPVGATIKGILAEIDKKKGSGTTKDSEVKIVKADGSVGTTNKADTVSNWPLSDTYISHGSSSDLWGETWTVTDINDADFGVVVSVSQSSSPAPATASVDHIRITVYYSQPGFLGFF